MKRFLRRTVSTLLSVLLVISMCISGMPVMALERDGSLVTDDGFEYEISDGSVTVTGYSGTDTVVRVPDEIGGLPVTQIGYCAFEDTGIVSLTIPGSVTSIDSAVITRGYEEYNEDEDYYVWVYTRNSTLESLVFEEGVEQIGMETFCNCTALTSVAIPESITWISNFAFTDCGLLEDVYYGGSPSKWSRSQILDEVLLGAEIHYGKSDFEYEIIGDEVTVTGYAGYDDQVTIPGEIEGKAVTAIGDSAFSGDFYKITIPATVTVIGENAFSGCPYLSDIYFEGSEAQWSAVEIGEGNDPLFENAVVFSNEEYQYVVYEDYGESKSVEIRKYKGTDTDVAVPSLIEGYPVKVIGAYAFSLNTALTSVTIPEGVETIGEKAFMDSTYLVSVSLPESLTSIGDDAFFGDFRLPSITIPDSVGQIGNYAFYNCEGITELVLPSELYWVGSCAFEGTSIASLTVPGGVYDIGIWFTHDEYVDGYYDDDGEWNEGYSYWTENSTLAEIVLRNGISHIDPDAFHCCTALESVTLPASISEIGTDAFFDCSSLTNATYDGSEDLWNTVSVGDGNKALESVIEFLGENDPSGLLYYLNYYGDAVIVGYTGSETEIVIPAEIDGYDVTEIGERAFQNRTDIVSVSVPDTVTEIGYCAFEGSGITSFTVPGSIPFVAQMWFTNGHEDYDEDENPIWVVEPNNTLSQLVFEEGVQQIYGGAFQGCAALTSVGLPESLSRIDSDTFKECGLLQDVYYAGTEEQWTAISENILDATILSAQIHFRSEFEYETDGDEVTITSYNGNSSEVVIPSEIDGKTVTAIGGGVFYAKEFSKITIPATVTSIGDFAFTSCPNLNEVYFEGTRAQWNAIEIGEGNDPLFDIYVSIVFTNGEYLYTVYGEDGEEDQYVQLWEYRGSASEVTIPAEMEGIPVRLVGNSLFRDNDTLTSVVIPEGIRQVQANVFYGCANLVSVSLPQSLEWISADAFYNCISLSSLTIPGGVVLIEPDAFEGTAISSLTVPGSVSDIDAWFTHETCEDDYYYWTQNSTLTEVILQSGVSVITSSAFRNCTGLTAITIPDTVTDIEDYAFDGCGSLSEVTYGGGPLSWAALRIGEGNEALADADVVCLGEDDPSGFTYYIDSEGNAVITGYIGSESEVVIPSVIGDGYPVTQIGERAFADRADIVSVTIPDMVTSIGFCAFDGCGITSLTIPGSVQIIDGYNALFTHPYEVYDPADGSYTSVYTENNTLTSLVFGDGVEIIGPWTFNNCVALTEITLPASISEIGNFVFDGCTQLYDVYYAGTEADWAALSENILDPTVLGAQIHFQNEFEYETDGDEVTITGYNGDSQEVVIPSQIDGKTVTAIGDSAFYAKDFGKITIPVTVTSIGEDAFNSCLNLTEVYYEGTRAQWNAIEIGEGNDPLSNYYTLIRFTNGECVYSVYGEDGDEDQYVQLWEYRGSDTSVTIPSEVEGIPVTVVGNSIFWGNEALTSVVIPEGVETVQGNAFRECVNLVSVSLPQSLRGIESYAFYHCSSLSSLTIPAEVEWIGLAAFAGTGISSLTVPGSITNIDPWFTEETSEPDGNNVDQRDESYWTQNSVLTEVILRSGVKYINDNAFRNCTALTEITIPETVLEIGDNAFDGCSSLTGVTYGGSPLAWAALTIGDGNEALEEADVVCLGEDDPSGFLYYVNDEDFAVITGYAGGLSEIEIPRLIGGYTVAQIAERAFAGRTDVTSVTIPNTVEVIGEGAFDGCGITSLTIPGSVQVVNAALFNHPYDQYDPENGWYVQVYTENDTLTSLVFEEGISWIGPWTFNNCTALTEIHLPKTVEEIGNFVFDGCDQLHDVYYAGTEEDWNALTENILDPTVLGARIHFAESNFQYEIDEDTGEVTITGYDHDKNWDWNPLTIPDTIEGHPVTAIGEWAFYRMYTQDSDSDAYVRVTIPDSILTIGEGAFSDCDRIYEIAYGGSLAQWNAIDIGENNALLTTRIAQHGDGIWSYISISFTGDPYDYKLSDESDLILTKYHGSEPNLEIPSAIYGYTVTGIGSDLAGGNSFLLSVVIPEGVTFIENFAFSWSKNLASVTIPDTVTRIGIGAFEATSITQITIPGSVNTVGGYLGGPFTYDRTAYIGGVAPGQEYVIDETLTTAVLEDGVRFIDDYAFRYCTALTEITIPESVVAIAAYAFSGCTSLETVYFAGTPMQWNAIVTQTGNEALLNAEVICARQDDPSGFLYRIDSEGNAVITGYAGTESEITIPTTIGGDYPVTAIAEGAFEGNTVITSVTIPAGVTSIGMAAFYQCTSLEEVVIPEGVTVINSAVFYGCSSLRDAYLPVSLEEIGAGAFDACTSLSDIFYSGSEAQWQQVRILGSGHDYLLAAQLHCMGTNVCGDYEYEINADDTVTITAYLGNGTAVVIPGKLNGRTVTGIGSDAFMSLNFLASVSIPASVSSLPSQPFCDCPALESITVAEGSEWYVSLDGVLFTKDMKTLVRYPENRPGTGYTVPDGVTKIGDSSFMSSNKLLSVELPDGLTEIESLAFNGVHYITEIIVPSSVTFIDESAFSYMYSLTSINIPDGITAIRRNTFGGCTSLVSVEIPASVTHIYFDAFDLCDALEDVYYSGTEDEWNLITIESEGNDALLNAEIHYPHVHQLVPVEAHEADHFHAGNCAYYVCEGCGKIFSDANGENEITIEDTVIPQIPHDFSGGWHSNETEHWHECECGEIADEAAHVFDDDLDAECNICGFVRTIPLLITAQPADVLTEAGSTASFTVGATGSGLTYQWQWRPGSNTAWKDSSSSTTGYNAATLKISATTARNGYQYRCIVTDVSGNTLASEAATLTLKAIVTVQPSDVTADVGDTATFTIAAIGSGLTYQWQWKSASSNWANSSSATTGYNTKTLKVTATAARNGYQYRCVVTDKYGNTATSDAATLTVRALLEITAHPNNVTADAGTTASFTVGATGSGLTYQWQWKSASSDWANSSSATTGYNAATLKVSATTGRNGYQYRCVVTDSYGNTATSNAATLTVRAALAITAHPRDVTADAGDTASFTVTATGSGLTYQWQWKSASSNWANSSSATTGYNAATLKVSATTGRNGYQYRCVVKDGNGNTVTSNAATLTVRAGLAITAHPKNVTAEAGTTASFTVTATGSGLTYQWQWRSGSNTSWANSSSSTTGYNAATLKISATAARNGYQYRCVVKDGSGNSVTTNAATLTVTTGPVITSQPASVSAAAGTTATFKVTATGTGLTYQWQWRAGTSGTWKDSSSSTTGYNTATLKISATTARNGYQYRCIVTDSKANTATSTAATLTVTSGPSITSQPASVTAAAGTTVSFTVGATGSGLTYQWQWRSGSNTAWKDSSSSTTGYNAATLKITATAARNGYQYRCVVTDGSGNTVTSNAAILTVK